MPQGDVFSHRWHREPQILFNLLNLPNPLNHREAVCCIKTSSCGTIERIERIFVRFPQGMRGREKKEAGRPCGHPASLFVF